MTERERDRALQTRWAVYNRAGGWCEVCNAPLDFRTYHMAHIVPKSKANLRKYGREIIHHPDNMKATCGLRCNAAVLIGCSPVAEAEHIAMIREKVEHGNATLH